MKFLKNLFYNLFNKRDKFGAPWSDYYSEKDRSIKFTNKSIYEYLKSNVGNDLNLYALNYFDTRITYREMFKKIDSISRSLKALGVQKGDVVSICMPNTPEAVMVFYASNNIGAVADMMHPLSAPLEVKHYLNESKSKILFLYDANYDKYKSALKETYIEKTIILSVKESMPIGTAIGYQILKGYKIKKAPFDGEIIMDYNKFLSYGQTYRKDVSDSSDAKDLALILHSGGTTGTPKGIMISNYNFNAEAQQGSINVKDVRPTDKIMTVLPIFHGFGLGVCVHCPLCIKCEVILIPEYDSKRFAKTIKEYRPNVLAGVPTLWEAMMSSKYFKKIDLSSIKYVVSGGDYLTISMENKMNEFLHERGANIYVSKGYGMTESVAATTYTYDGTNEPGSIGIPMVGNLYCVCKPYSIETLPYEKEGELCVCGPTVMMGYLNNKEETDNVLKKHADGKIWLHTGDIGYIRENGVIYFTQRLKRVIVSSGFNVYPSLIEEVIEKHKDVKKCCVIGIPHPYKMQVAKAFVVLKDGVKPSTVLKAEIKLLCKKELALYSQPKEIEFRTELPKTLYNKIDYRKLEKESTMKDE